MKNLFKVMSVLMFALVLMSGSCEDNGQQKSDSGATKATTKIKTDADGHTTEQKNIIERLQRDNQVGQVKHLYVISSYSGDVLEYSTVKGKVTSGGKRLSPKTVNGDGYDSPGACNYVNIGRTKYTTDEVLDDGGAYGESGNYLFWFDAQDNYHQYYPSGGTYIHISEKPLKIRKSNLTLTVQ
jgi:hypothetical protein